MTDTKWTAGPWGIGELANRCQIDIGVVSGNWVVADVCGDCNYGDNGEPMANAHLIAAAPGLYREMERYLPVLERAEANPDIWVRLTEGLGIATANGYRHQMAKARGES